MRRDDLHDPAHVGGVIGDDDHVGRAVGIDLPGGGHQRPQHRDQLYGAHILDRNDLRDDFIGGRTDMILQVVGCPDRSAGWHPE